MSWASAYFWRTLVVQRPWRPTCDVFFVGAVLGLSGKDAAWCLQESEAWWLLGRLVHQLRNRRAGLDILGCPWRCQQSKAPCRPASSGVIGLSESSCHLLSAVHYHFFLSNLWHSDPCGWQVVVLILWQFQFSQGDECSYFESVSWRKGMSYKGTILPVPCKLFHQVTAIMISQPSVICVTQPLCVQYLTFRT